MNRVIALEISVVQLQITCDAALNHVCFWKNHVSFLKKHL